MSKITPVISDFTRGELSPRMEGRSDSEAFYQGVSELRNMIVLPQGGIEKRPGTEYIMDAKISSRESRLISFVIDPVERYLVELYHNGIRIIDISSDPPEIFNKTWTLTLNVAPSQPWAVGNGIEDVAGNLYGRVVKQLTTTAYQIADAIASPTTSIELRGKDEDGVTRAALQTGAYPTITENTTENVVALNNAAFWPEDGIQGLKFVQANKQIVFAHEDYPPRVLTLIGSDGWALSSMNIRIPLWRAYNE